MVALGCGWGKNTTDGTKGNIFSGFDFTLDYDVAYSYDLGALLADRFASEPKRYGRWS
jgi:hypothetical protein